MFDVILQDDTSAQTQLLFNSTSGDYVFTHVGPSTTTLRGPGAIQRTGCFIELQHNTADRRVFGAVDTCNRTGNALVQTFTPAMNFRITDSDVRNNTCSICNP